MYTTHMENVDFLSTIEEMVEHFEHCNFCIRAKKKKKKTKCIRKK